MIDVFGIKVPSTSPAFLVFVGIHVIAGLVCVIAGVVAMLSRKEPGRHPRFGTIYFWGLVATVATASILSIMRWSEDYHLFILGNIAFGAALLGRTARRRSWQYWAPLHIGGMGTSYIVLLTAFYVDNGMNLPIWRELPPLAYWTVPAAIGLPIMSWALLYHRPIRNRLENT